MQKKHNTSNRWLSAYKYGTNAAVYGTFVWYGYQYAITDFNGNHIYSVVALFPVLASAATAILIAVTPARSPFRVLYVVGVLTFGWLV